MLTNDDVKKIVDANKEVFHTKEEIDDKFDDLRKDFSNLQTSVDKYAHKADKYFQEHILLSKQVSRHEEWIKQIADKLGVKLEYYGKPAEGSVEASN